MKIVGRILALVLALLATVLFTGAACSLAIYSAVSNSENVKSTFSNQNIYSEILPFALPAIFEATDINTAPVPISSISRNLDPGAWRAVANELIPSEWLEAQLETLIDSTYAAVQGEEYVIAEPIDLTALTVNLTGDRTQEIVAKILEGSPRCDSDQTTLIQQYANGENITEPFPVCDPPDELLATSENVFTEMLSEIANQLEEIGSLQTETLLIEDDAIQVMRLIYEIANQLIILLYLCPVAIVALIIVATVRSTKSFGRWTGWTSIVTGALVIILLIMLQMALFDFFTDTYSPGNDVERFQQLFAVSLTRSIFSDMSGSLLLQAGAFVALGFILLFIAMTIKQTRTSPTNTITFQTGDGRIITTTSEELAAFSQSKQGDKPEN